MRLSSLRMSTPLPILILMCPARVHSSSSALKSSFPAFSDDHIFTREYGSEYNSTFLPVIPWASRTIRRLFVNTALSRNVLYAAIGSSPGTSIGPMSEGIATSETNVHDVIAAVSTKSPFVRHEAAGAATPTTLLTSAPASMRAGTPRLGLRGSDGKPQDRLTPY